jgi:hypothetical protein
VFELSTSHLLAGALPLEPLCQPSSLKILILILNIIYPTSPNILIGYYRKISGTE